MITIGQDEVINFIQHQIIYRFGILETILANQLKMFTSDKMVAFMQRFQIKTNTFLSLYYTQANEQVKETNRTIIDVSKKTIEDKPRKLYEPCKKFYGL